MNNTVTYPSIQDGTFEHGGAQYRIFRGYLFGVSTRGMLGLPYSEYPSLWEVALRRLGERK